MATPAGPFTSVHRPRLRATGSAVVALLMVAGCTTPEVAPYPTAPVVTTSRPTPTRAVTPTQDPPVTSHEILVKADASVAATVRWNDGTHLHTKGLAAGKAGRWKFTVPGDFIVVVSVASAQPGKVSCGFEVDGEDWNTRTTRTGRGDGAAVTICGARSPRPRVGTSAGSGAHLVATSNGELTAFWFTPTVSSSFTAGEARSSEQLDSGTVLSIVASGDGAAACEVSVDGRIAATQKVANTGEIAVCRATVPSGGGAARARRSASSLRCPGRA